MTWLSLAKKHEWLSLWLNLSQPSERCLNPLRVLHVCMSVSCLRQTHNATACDLTAPLSGEGGKRVNRTGGFANARPLGVEWAIGIQ